MNGEEVLETHRQIIINTIDIVFKLNQSRENYFIKIIFYVSVAVQIDQRSWFSHPVTMNNFIRQRTCMERSSTFEYLL
jgi:hypothetical protein